MKIHVDFCRHPETNLDRRLNLLLYLNKDWREEYGGHLELFDTDVESCQKKILPLFNRMVIFNTTDYTYHGHPDPLTCPQGLCRNSLALYYFSNGRPLSELRNDLESQSTLYRARRGESFNVDISYIIRQCLPPALYPIARRFSSLFKAK